MEECKLFTDRNPKKQNEPIVPSIPFERRSVAFRRALLFSLPIFGSWFFYFSLFYPGLMSIDSFMQFDQAVTGHYMDAHPVFHTLIWTVLLRLWFSPAVMAIFQIVLVGATVGYSLYILIKHKIRKIALIAVSAFYAISPVYGMLNISLWKDIPYAASFLLMITVLYVIVQNEQAVYRISTAFLFCLSGIGVILFRHNGILAACVTFLLYLLFFPKIRRRLLLLIAVVAVSVAMIKGPLYSRVGAEKAGLGILLGIPLHQIQALIDREQYRTAVLRGDREWTVLVQANGYKLISTAWPGGEDTSDQVTGDGKKFRMSGGDYSGPGRSTLYRNVLYLTLSNRDTGWKNDHTPDQAELKKFFEQHPFTIAYKPKVLSADPLNRRTPHEKQVLEQMLSGQEWATTYAKYYNSVVLNPHFQKGELTPGQLFEVWWPLFRNHPGIFLTDWSYMTSIIWQIKQPDDGYIYPFDWEIMDNKYGFRNTTIFPQAKEIMVKALTFSLRPSVSWLMWRPALLLTLMLMASAVFLFGRSRKMALLVLPVLADLSGLLVTIPAQDVRYVYAVFLIAPFILGSVFALRQNERSINPPLGENDR